MEVLNIVEVLLDIFFREWKYITWDVFFKHYHTVNISNNVISRYISSGMDPK